MAGVSVDRVETEAETGAMLLQVHDRTPDIARKPPEAGPRTERMVPRGPHKGPSPSSREARQRGLPGGEGGAQL